jgi:hypothetical protein
MIREVGLALVSLGLSLLAGSCSPPAAAQGSGRPAAVECKLFWRASNEVGPGESPGDPKFQFQERVARAEPGKPAQASLADVTLSVSYTADEFEGSSVSVGAAFDGKPLVTSLYQLERSPPPRNQFAGGHGFTGLVYLSHPTKGGDYQFICQFVGS